MSHIVNLTRGDSNNTTTLNLTDKDSGVAIDLTNVTSMALKLRVASGTTVLATLVPTVLGTPTSGQVEVTWTSAFQLNNAGWYDGELEITEAGPKTTTANRILKIYLREQF